jgi:hypothetical protein
MDAGSVFLIVVGALLISAVWYAGVRRRTAMTTELQRQFTEQAATTQRALTEISATLAELDRRTADMQRILKDAD